MGRDKRIDEEYKPPVALRYFVPSSRKRSDVAYVVLSRWDTADGPDFCVEYLDLRYEEVIPDECFASEHAAESRVLDVYGLTAISWQSGAPWLAE